MDGPVLEINLPSGWGEAELRALLAPVDDVHVTLLPYGMARIKFSDEEGARKAAMLMEANEVASRGRSPLLSRSPSPTRAVRPTPASVSYSGSAPPAQPPHDALYSPARPPGSPQASSYGAFRSASPPLFPFAMDYPAPPPHSPHLTCAPAVSTTLLAAHRNTWRLVETLHISLIELAKAGPLHKADTLLQRLQIATLARQVEEQTAEADKLRRKLEENKKALSSMGVSKNVTYDIQKQLTEAAGMVQSTQKQLQDARERMKRADESKEESKRAEAEARRQLQDAIRGHSRELDLKTQQAANLSSKLAFLEMLRSVEYAELDGRFAITNAEDEDRTATTADCSKSLIAVLAEETQGLNQALHQEMEDKVQLRKQSQRDLAQIKDTHLRALEGARRAKAAQEESAAEALEEAKSQARLRQEREDALQSTQQQQADAMAQQRAEHEAAMEAAAQAHEAAVAALKEETEKAGAAQKLELEELQEQNADLTTSNLELHAQLDVLQGRLDEVEAAGEGHVAELQPLKLKNFELQEQLDRSNSRLQELTDNLEAEVARAQDDAAQGIAEAKADAAMTHKAKADARIETLLEEHQSIIRSMEAAHAAEMAAKDEELVVAGCERDSLRQQGESLLKNTQEAAENTIQEQQEKIALLTAQIAAMEGAVAREAEVKVSIDADHRRQTAEFTALVARMRAADDAKEAAEQERRGLQLKVDDLVGELTVVRQRAEQLAVEAAATPLAEQQRAQLLAAAEEEQARLRVAQQELATQLAVSEGDRSAKAAEAEMWRKEATLRGDACEEVARLEKKVEFLTDRENQLKNALRNSGAELDQLASTFHATQSSLQAKSATIESLTSNLRLVTAEHDAAKAKAQEAQWYEEQHRLASSEATEAKSELRRQKADAGRLKDELARRADEFKEEEEHHKREVAKMKDTIAKQKERLEKLNEEAQSSRAQLGKAAASLEEAVKAHTAESTSRQQSIRHQLLEEERLKATSREHQEQLVSLRANLHSLAKELDAEKGRVRDLEALCKTATENYRQTREDADFLTSENKQLKYDLQQTKIQRSGDAKASAALHKKIADERDEFEKQATGLTSEGNELKSRLSFLETEESAAQAAIAELNEELDTTRERLRNAQQALGEMKEREAKLTKALAQAHARCDTLEEEIRVKLAAPPPEPADCKQCEIFQAARHLQQEVMAGLQADAANAAADAEAARLTLTDYEARNTRLETELASLRMIVADSEAHIARLEARPTEDEYARVAARVTAAEAAAAAMEGDARTALGDATRISDEMQEKSAEIKRLHTQLCMLEQHGRDTEGVLRDTIDNQERALQATLNASYIAERDTYPVEGVAFTLYKDGTFGRGQVDGYWYLDSYTPPEGQVGGLELRLLWSSENEEDLLISDTHGMTWVGRGHDAFKLTAVGATPDWFKAEVFRKCLEAAESRAAQAQWKLQSSAPASAGPSAYQALAATAGSPIRGLHSPLVDLAGYAAQPPPSALPLNSNDTVPQPFLSMPAVHAPPVAAGGYSPGNASPTPPTFPLDPPVASGSFLNASMASGVSQHTVSPGLRAVTPPQGTLRHGSTADATASPLMPAPGALGPAPVPPQDLSTPRPGSFQVKGGADLRRSPSAVASVPATLSRVGSIPPSVPLSPGARSYADSVAAPSVPSQRLPSMGAASHGVRSSATDARDIESEYSQQFPTADRTVVSGLAHQVAEGTMSDTQATQMLTDMVSGEDDF